MKRALRCAFAGLALVAAVQVPAADDPAARAMLDEAFRHQEALPVYVERLFGRSPVIPTDIGVLAGKITDRLTEKLRESVSVAVAQVPAVAIIADSALARLQQQSDDELALVFGPEKEFLTIQHAGKRQREIFAEGLGELVRANGQMALILDLQPQIARLKAMAAVDAAEIAIDQVQSTRLTLRSLSMGLVESGAIGLLGVAAGVFDDVNSLLSRIRFNSELRKAASMLEELSGHWRCSPDDSFDEEIVSQNEVQQLADEEIDGQATQVYLETRVYEETFRLQVLTWVTISDGLPIRSVYLLPSGDRQRTDFEYPTSIEFELPDCVKG